MVERKAVRFNESVHVMYFMQSTIFSSTICLSSHQGIKFKRIGAPQPEDIIKSSAEDAKR